MKPFLLLFALLFNPRLTGSRPRIQPSRTPWRVRRTRWTAHSH